MAIHVGLVHRTVYRFDRPVQLGPHLIRLRPAPHCRTPIESYALTIAGGRYYLNWQQDPFGNHLARLVVPEPVRHLEVRVDLTADMTVINPFDFFLDESAETFPFTYEPALAADLEPYRRPVTPPAPALYSWLDHHARVSGVGTVTFLAQLNQAVARTVGYTVRMEHGVQDPEMTLRLGSGSCRDSAWLLVAALREVGLAARFVSGYLVQLTPDNLSEGGLGGVAKDFTDLHAWAEVYLPGAGWVGLDATSGLFAGEGHIPLSATPHPADAAPITGTTDFAITTMEFSNEVFRIREDPRVTRPYTDEQWGAVLTLGERIDERLADDDVRLTMGGEPTFVAADAGDSVQWSIAADGPEKRRLGAELARLLAARYAPHGVVHHGQGKWYPGEPLPRWQKAITWAADGSALWPDPALLDDPDLPAPFPDAPSAHQRAQALTLRIAAGLGIGAEFVLPAYEDRLARLAAEAMLPEGPPPTVDPDRPMAADARAELVAALDADTPDPTGWVVPMHAAPHGAGWATVRWSLRRGRLVLRGGSSPIGLRLPLDSIAWTAPPVTIEPTGFEPLTESLFLRAPQAAVTPVEDAPTTALCVQARDGHVFVFLPPLQRFDEAADLLAVIAAAATELACPVVLEGYPIPGGGRSQGITVTPDPGVIEVNVQPAASWSELVSITETLDDAAREVGLITEKFALDGTHTGTGGGSHLTLGGARPADSPLLRRPDLLVSLLTFWQHHPSLSYLFSGRFIGPTSQAPRVDEARHDSLYELEIAFEELERLGDEVFPWTVDRSLRNLLTDLTGNTHRAEFCIDKLYSPDSERGRLGLLELRGFEMPPHPQMSLVQALLVRCLVSRFWREPYRAPLVRWGAGLHDRFLLPAFIEADIADVVADLAAHDIDFDASWLVPFTEFRFPRLGTAQFGPVGAQLRGAIEPWHVLGEEAAAGGTARYVDSSVERVQVSLTGATAGRHVLTCNGVPVPLNHVGGELVAGVRFKAWQPPSGLHPTIGVHSPLIFDVVDLWSGRALGGFTYHVIHPGGRAYERFPVNANEAEARRASRFEARGHWPDAESAAREARPAPAEYGYTLDLRRTGRSASW